MQYRTKLLLVVLSLVLFSNCLTFLVLYTQARRFMLGELHSKAVSIAASTAKMTNGDALATLKTRGDEDSVAYSTLQRTLRAVRDANRREGIFVEHVYTLSRSPNDPDELRFGVDSENRGRYKANVGDVYVSGTRSGLSKHLDKPYSEPGFGAGGSASWISGHAPVYDRNGKFVGAIGVGVSAEETLALLSSYAWVGFAQIAGALIVAWALAMRLIRPIAGREPTSGTLPGAGSKPPQDSAFRRAA